MAEILTPEHFTPHVGRAFRIRDGRHVFTLAKVDVGQAAEGWPRQLFNLIFHGPPGDVLPEGFYSVDVEEDGSAFELYLMPVQTVARDRQDYQAAFN